MSEPASTVAKEPRPGREARRATFGASLWSCRSAHKRGGRAPSAGA